MPWRAQNSIILVSTTGDGVGDAEIHFTAADQSHVGRFLADLQMYASGMGQPDPERFMDRYVSWEIATKANKWQGRNSTRWSSPEYDATYTAAQSEMDPIKRAAMFIKMNELAIAGVCIIPVVYRPRTSGAVNSLVAPLSGWDNDLWLLKDWYRNT